jgi:cytochrome bd ubiquinol oxidase subunit I
VHATDWWAIIFNPSMPYRLSHMLLASGLTVAFLIAGLSAFRWLRATAAPAVATGLRFGLMAGRGADPGADLAGDMHGLNTLEHQPQKVAAMEGNWETGGNVPCSCSPCPMRPRENRFEIGIPSAPPDPDAQPDGVVPGLNDFVAEDGTPLHPPVAPCSGLPGHGGGRAWRCWRCPGRVA